MIDFAYIKAALDAITKNGVGDIDNSPHSAFWWVTRDEFLANEVPNIVRGGVTYHIKIVDTAHPSESPFFKVLLASLPVTEGTHSTTIPKMPKGGPFITDDEYSVTINGVAKTGLEIQTDILFWLNNGMP